MENKIGQEFKGFISSVTHFGFYVELPDTVEGLVPIESLKDYYMYNENTHELLGQDEVPVFKIGNEIKVKLSNVNVDAREITFEII